jgi:glycosyltransferase involved in cell wall biosynthesis
VTPLLSICVPTYNRAHLLRLCLEALLPQVARCSDRVEVWVSDNASPDNTQETIEAARSLGPLQAVRNARNIQGCPNMIQAACDLARGEYVWVIGDDDLVRPGAVARVLGCLEAHPEIDAYYMNCRYASHEFHWPENAIGGYDGPCSGINNPKVTDYPVAAWHEHLSAPNMICTAVFAQVARRHIWLRYWKRGRPFERRSFCEQVFPHTTAIASAAFNRPSYYIGEPVLTWFAGAQSWLRSPAECRVFLLRIPELLRWYQQLGLSGDRLRECERWVFSLGIGSLARILTDEPHPDNPTVGSYLRISWPYWSAWKQLFHGIRAAGKPWLLSKFLGGCVRLQSLALSFRGS